MLKDYWKTRSMELTKCCLNVFRKREENGCWKRKLTFHILSLILSDAIILFLIAYSTKSPDMLWNKHYIPKWSISRFLFCDDLVFVFEKSHDNIDWLSFFLWKLGKWIKMGSSRVKNLYINMFGFISGTKTSYIKGFCCIFLKIPISSKLEVLWILN